MVKLTVNIVKNSKYEGKTKIIWDESMPCFGLRLLQKENIYVIKYRNKFGSQKWYKIGKANILSLDQAKKLAREYLERISKGEDPSSDKIGNKKALSISDLCDWYMKEGVAHKKQSTLQIDKGRIKRHIKPLIGKVKVKELTRGDVETMMYDIQKGDKIFVDEKTKLRGRAIVSGGDCAASRTVQLLGAILKFAIDHNIIKENPAHGIKKPKSKSKKEFLNWEQVEHLGKILNSPKLFPFQDKAKTIIKLNLLTGCRPREIAALKWEEIDFQHQCFHFLDTKTGPQTRPFGRSVHNILANLPNRKKEGWVFPATFGTGFYVNTPKLIRNIRCLKEDNEYLLNPKIGLHGLRHTFASLASDLGYNEFTIAGIIGHKLGTITSRYTHNVDSSLLLAVDRISYEIEQALEGKRRDNTNNKIIDIAKIA